MPGWLDFSFGDLPLVSAFPVFRCRLADLGSGRRGGMGGMVPGAQAEDLPVRRAGDILDDDGIGFDFRGAVCPYWLFRVSEVPALFAYLHARRCVKRGVLFSTPDEPWPKSL